MTDDKAMRISICKGFISLLESTPDDPRQPEALRYYRAQLAELEGKPAPIVIGLKTATISAKVPKEK